MGTGKGKVGQKILKTHEINQFHGIFLWIFSIFREKFMGNLQKKIREIDLFDFTSFFGQIKNYVKKFLMQVREWNILPSENKPFMCTARPNWLSLSTTFFNKDACHKIPIPLYDILELNEKKMTVRVEPMVSVGDITKYLIPKGYTLAVTLEIAGK